MPEKPKKKLLYIFGEDDQYNLRAIQQRLGGLFSLTAAGTACQALELLGRQKFDLIMMEIYGLPKGEEFKEHIWKTSWPALDVLRRLRNNEFAGSGNNSGLPVYVLTGLALAESEEVTKQYGPIVLHQMPEKISTIIAACQELAGT